MKSLPWAAASLFLLAVLAPATASTDAATAAGYDWVISVDDPQDDHTGPNALAGGPVPGTFNHENDLLRVEVTDDATTFAIRVTTQTCDFDVPVGFALVIFELTGPGGEDWDTSVAYDDGCTNPRGIEVDSVLGDGDVPMPGLRYEADPDNNQIYILSDYAENGMAPGGAVAFDRVHTGRQFAGRYTFGMDEATVPPFTVGSGAAAASGPALVTDNATMPLEQTFEAPSNETHELTWPSPHANATFDLEVAPTRGSVTVNVTDAAGTVAFLFQYGDKNNTAGSTRESRTGLAPGVWTIRIAYTDFAGTLRLDIAEHVPSLDAPAETPKTGGAPASDDNGTNGPTLDAVASEDAPGPALPLLALGLLLAVAVMRRRR